MAIENIQGKKGYIYLKITDIGFIARFIAHDNSFDDNF